MSIDTPNVITKSAKQFFYGTFLSRISGFFRDAILAFFFGASPIIAAFMVAFRFSNLLRRLFGEGTIQSGFIPHFEALKKEDEKKSIYFFRDTFFSLSVVLVSIVFFIEVILYFINRNVPSDIIEYSMIMLPGLVFICLYSLNAALLQCKNYYFFSGASPMVFNMVIIGASLFFRKNNSIGMVLSQAVVLSFFLQWLITFYKSIQISNVSLKDLISFSLFSKDLKVLIKPISLGIIGTCAVQINSALDSLFARFSDLQGPAFLWYAMRVYQLPLALFAIAISSAMLPPLSRAESFEKFKNLFNVSLNKTLVLMLFSTLGIFVFGGSLINLMYGRGSFSNSSTWQTLYCLWGYGFGLVFAALTIIFANVLYAKKNYFIPVVASVVSVIVNILLNSIFIFIFDFSTYAVAYATSISSLINCFILGVYLHNKYKIFSKDIIFIFIKIIFCLAVAFLCVYQVERFLDLKNIGSIWSEEGIFSRDFITQIVQFSILFFTYVGAFFSLGYILKIKEIKSIIKV